jgi:hypothetical protein
VAGAETKKEKRFSNGLGEFSPDKIGRESHMNVIGV